MARTFIRQSTQIRKSDTYSDSLSAGSTLESAAVTIEDDLNALRSQVKRITGDANWYASLSGRSLATLSTDLTDIEGKKTLFRSDLLTDITVPSSQNWKILSVASSEAPSEAAAVAGSANGAVVVQSALNGAGFNVHELIEVAGATAITPKNLMVVRDASTGQPIQSGSKDVYALLQYESTGVDGAAFNDTSAGNRVKLSFVILNAGLDDLIACPVVDIEGKSINYSYVRRINFDAIPEQAFLSGSFVDLSSAANVTLDTAIDNQSTTPATQATDVFWRIDDTKSLKFQTSDGGVDLLAISPASGGDVLQVNVDTLDINNVNRADFLNGARFDSGGTAIDVGDVAGEITSAGALTLKSTGANNVTLNSTQDIAFVDTNKGGSTYSGSLLLSDTAAEWSNFETAFGEVSLLRGIAQAKRRDKVYANITANESADTDIGGVAGGTNLDTQLPDMSLGSFLIDYDVYFNGELLRPGANSGANNDYYPGTSLANGQLKFEFNVKSGDVLCVVPYTRY